ncbi:hypothetical protein BCR34DRAFT_589012 [Clohesyomyces aquaticus]|uniref:Transmembrane protein n=1 Tax=Clohesyomyces aquaticus TaxID=1231657 RepID=A0A1Y1ZHS8_9PLEO|nr:hypothetical protein BCR34DRAFT_589012 [Clohesyomyces aquaticus]
MWSDAVTPQTPMGCPAQPTGLGDLHQLCKSPGCGSRPNICFNAKLVIDGSTWFSMARAKPKIVSVWGVYRIGRHPASEAVPHASAHKLGFGLGLRQNAAKNPSYPGVIQRARTTANSGSVPYQSLGDPCPMDKFLLERNAHDDSGGHSSQGNHNDDLAPVPSPVPAAPTALNPAFISFLSEHESEYNSWASSSTVLEPSSSRMPYSRESGGAHPTGPFTAGWPEGHPSITNLPSSPTTLSTKTNGYGPPYSEHYSSNTPTPIYTDLPGPSSTNRNDDGGNEGEFQRKGTNHTIMYAMGGIVPVVMLAFLGLALFFYLRKRKQKKAIAQQNTRIQEMKSRNSAAYILPISQQRGGGAPPPLQTTQPHYAVPSNPTPLRSPTAPAPVILGPIAPVSNGAYYTGIDTSDVVSMTGPTHTHTHDRTGLGNPFLDGDDQEEPPPPYRPTSLPPISRDTSLRVPATHSQTNLMASDDPFADPPNVSGRDDDAVSVLSGPLPERGERTGEDNMSVVSDLSYQNDPVVQRSAV